jgi:hypothetical protein
VRLAMLLVRAKPSCGERHTLATGSIALPQGMIPRASGPQEIGEGDEQMKLRNLMVIKAVVCLGFGILLLAIPGLLMSLYGVTLDQGGILMARLYGASLVGNLMLTWFSRNDPGSEALRAAVLGLFVYDAIGLIVAIVATLAGVFNVLGWGIVAIYLFLTVGYGYFYFVKPSES